MKRIILFLLISLASYSEKIVEYRIISPKEISLGREFSGLVSSKTSSKLSFKVGGRIKDKFVKLGDRVVRGSLLAKLDSVDYELKYESNIANLEKGRANLAEARSNYLRMKTLYLKNATSKASYDNAVSTYKSARATIKTLEKQVELSRLQLSYTKLIAPSEGIVVSEEAEVNENVNGGTPVYIISNSDSLEIRTYIPEDFINKIYKEQEVKVTINALNNEKVSGRVTRVGRATTKRGRTYPVKVELNRVLPKLKEGMNAKLVFDLALNGESEKKSYTVPLQSVLKDPTGRKFIYVVELVGDKRGKIKKRYVRYGKVSSYGLEILSGLEKNDKIVVNGMSRIKEGEEVSYREAEGGY